MGYTNGLSFLQMLLLSQLELPLQNHQLLICGHAATIRELLLNLLLLDQPYRSGASARSHGGRRIAIAIAVAWMGRQFLAQLVLHFCLRAPKCWRCALLSVSAIIKSTSTPGTARTAARTWWPYWRIRAR
jgi:hypothetical protein